MSQHKVIDLTGFLPDTRKYKRKLTFSELRNERKTKEAIDALLGDRLKQLKSESKTIIKDEHGRSDPLSERLEDSAPLGTAAGIEWWDEYVLEHPESITHLIEHPVPLKGTTALAKQALVTGKAMLTPAEREKLRKLKKKERVQDLQEKIKMGLLKPPPPKIKMKNLMLVLGKEAVAGPSAVEQMVKAQVEQRLRDHEQRNADRKLSPEERREKNIAKWTRPLEKASVLKMSAYLIYKRINNKIRFKIMKNAEQLHVGGVFLNSKLQKNTLDYYPSLVVVEGSRKAVKRFDRLMLNRINWLEEIKFEKEQGKMEDENVQDDASDENDEEEDDELQGPRTNEGVCVRIFHGSESKKKFSRWSYQELREYESGMVFLQERGCMHFWEMIERFRSKELDV